MHHTLLAPLTRFPLPGEAPRSSQAISRHHSVPFHIQEVYPRTASVSSGKMTPRDAKEELLTTYTNTKQHIEGLKYTEAELAELMIHFKERKEH